MRFHISLCTYVLVFWAPTSKCTWRVMVITTTNTLDHDQTCALGCLIFRYARPACSHYATSSTKGGAHRAQLRRRVFGVMHAHTAEDVYVMVTVLTQVVRVKDGRGDITCNTRRERGRDAHADTRSNLIISKCAATPVLGRPLRVGVGVRVHHFVGSQSHRAACISPSHNDCKQVAHIRKSGNQAHKFDHDPVFSLLMTITRHVHFDVGAKKSNTYVHRLI